MVKVDLIAHTNVNPIKLAQFGANICYNDQVPFWGKSEIDVKKALFDKGHHTTFQHWYVTFVIEGIAVSDITFGFHLTHPFYNTGQRSGRYCSNMFNKPSYVEEIENYISQFWPETKSEQIKKILDYVKFGIDIYNSNLPSVEKLAKEFLLKERPNVPWEVSENQRKKGFKGHKNNASKIAQEQMRVFISTIFPTAFTHTLNLTALAALYESAWTPAMKWITDEMTRLLVEKFPELSFMFRKNIRRKDEWQMKIPPISLVSVIKSPKLKLLEIDEAENFIFASNNIKHPLDKLNFTPEILDNSIGGMKTEIEVSIATMGQDQRHRTLQRSHPVFTGNFYLPPLLAELKLEKEAEKLMSEWINLFNKEKIAKTLAIILAPYGAMVRYRKRGSFNAILHEQGKRLCWLAQEEIYHLGRLLRLAVKKNKGGNSLLLSIFNPPCYETGVCGEGNRYCGRKINAYCVKDYFPKRKI